MECLDAIDGCSTWCTGSLYCNDGHSFFGLVLLKIFSCKYVLIFNAEYIFFNFIPPILNFIFPDLEGK